MLNSSSISINHGLSMLKGLLALSLLVATPVHSDTLNTADGQAFDSAQFQELTLDVAARAGPDSQRLGVRVTLPKFLSHYVPFVEASTSQGNWDDLAVNGDTKFSGSGKGAGLYFTGIPEWKKLSTTLKFSYSEEDNNVDTPIVVSGRIANVDHELQTLSAGVLISPKNPIMDNGLNAYVALALVNNRSRRRVLVDQQEELRLAKADDSINGYFAAGIVYPTNRLRFYGVLEVQEEVSISLGVRWHITNTKHQ
jgi:hypothetical protein